jgi:hypothetical protein
VYQQIPAPPAPDDGPLFERSISMATLCCDPFPKIEGAFDGGGFHRIEGSFPAQGLSWKRWCCVLWNSEQDKHSSLIPQLDPETLRRPYDGLNPANRTGPAKVCLLVQESLIEGHPDACDSKKDPEENFPIPRQSEGERDHKDEDYASSNQTWIHPKPVCKQNRKDGRPCWTVG